MKKSCEAEPYELYELQELFELREPYEPGELYELDGFEFTCGTKRWHFGCYCNL